MTQRGAGGIGESKTPGRALLTKQTMNRINKKGYQQMGNLATYRYSEDHAAGHHSRHRTSRDVLQSFLQRTVTPEVKPLAWNDIANWRGKTVYGLLNGKRQRLNIVNRAPDGNEGERWYVMPLNNTRFVQMSISKATLELSNPYALAVIPSVEIKTRRVGRVLTTPNVIYL